MLHKAEKVLRRGESVLIFPEGTRSADGEIGTFKEGAFRLAKDTSRPLIPVLIQGTREVVPRGGFAFNRGVNIRISVLPVQAAEGSIYELRTICRDRMKAELSRLREEDAN